MRGAPTVRIKSADRGFPDRNFAAFRKDEHLQLKLIAVSVQSLQKRQQRKRKRTETALRIIERDPEEKTHQRTGNAVPETATERDPLPVEVAHSENQIFRMRQMLARNSEDVLHAVLSIGIQRNHAGTAGMMRDQIIEPQFQRRALPRIFLMREQNGGGNLPSDEIEHRFRRRTAAVIDDDQCGKAVLRELAEQSAQTLIRIIRRNQKSGSGKIHGRSGNHSSSFVPI